MDVKLYFRCMIEKYLYFRGNVTYILHVKFEVSRHFNFLHKFIVQSCYSFHNVFECFIMTWKPFIQIFCSKSLGTLKIITETFYVLLSLKKDQRIRQRLRFNVCMVHFVMKRTMKTMQEYTPWQQPYRLLWKEKPSSLEANLSLGSLHSVYRESKQAF